MDRGWKSKKLLSVSPAGHYRIHGITYCCGREGGKKSTEKISNEMVQSHTSNPFCYFVFSISILLSFNVATILSIYLYTGWVTHETSISTWDFITLYKCQWTDLHIIFLLNAKLFIAKVSSIDPTSIDVKSKHELFPVLFSVQSKKCHFPRKNDDWLTVLVQRYSDVHDRYKTEISAGDDEKQRKIGLYLEYRADWA